MWGRGGESLRFLAEFIAVLEWGTLFRYGVPDLEAVFGHHED